MLLWKVTLSWCHKQMTFMIVSMTCSTSTFDVLMNQTPKKSQGSMLMLQLAVIASRAVCTRTSSVWWLWGSQSPAALLLHSSTDLRSTASPTGTSWMLGFSPCLHVYVRLYGVPWIRCVVTVLLGKLTVKRNCSGYIVSMMSAGRLISTLGNINIVILGVMHSDRLRCLLSFSCILHACIYVSVKCNGKPHVQFAYKFQ